MISTQIDIPYEKIEDFCEKWHIQSFALFGSVLRDDLNDSSDIDVLVDFTDDMHYTLFDLARMGAELEIIFERSVDLLDLQAVMESANHIRRDEILRHAEVIYGA